MGAVAERLIETAVWKFACLVARTKFCKVTYIKRETFLELAFIYLLFCRYAYICVLEYLLSK